MYITGGCGALYDGASPDGSKRQRSIARVHQAYGRNYQLPSTTAHNETCANIGNVLWNWRMFLVTGEAKFIDVTELALYNSVLSGVDLGGENYFYTNPPPDTQIAMDVRNAPNRQVRHVIARGDTLSEIAARYNVSTAAIRSANRLSNDRIRVGQTLSIPLFPGT